MAEVPPGPSSLLAPPGAATNASLLSPFPGEEEEEEEEEEGRRVGGGRPLEEEEAGDEGCLRRPHRRNHQLNGLILATGPHLRGSLKKGQALSQNSSSSSNQKQCPPPSNTTFPGKAMGHGQEPPQEEEEEEQEGRGQEQPLPPPSLSNHHRVSLHQGRTAQPHQHHMEAPSDPSAGDRNGLDGGAEEEEEGDEEEEESLILLSRSLASACSLKPCAAGAPVDSSWPPRQQRRRRQQQQQRQRTEEEESEDPTIGYVRYESELQMPDIMRLITKDLSEPYSIYTYRYFIHNWPQLCFLAMVGDECVGAIVCKLDMHKKMFRRGYIAMLAVDSKYRRKGIGTNLVKKAIYAMVEGDCDEVVLETEITNKSALKLYENLGFVRDKRLFRYYLNGVDALRLKLWLR
ncbi:N-alpha-acetyltransferase 30 [Sceloporus undulatus]|uniref:N-alpha-acetyltransferase 30 n=1 Tax=Sceloporus undulatus TaxID=8520 RepID=UPI001C4C4809|nr:N-alpha-acetyltransferase 30 [Sceloporus undulatus]